MKNKNSRIANETESIELEMRKLQIISVEQERDFIAFLNNCSERLNKGDSVQVIWNDYRNSVC